MQDYCLNIGSNLSSLPSEPTPCPVDVFEKSQAMLMDELSRCSALGLTQFNLHPGASMGEGTEQCLDRIAQALNQAHQQVPSVITGVFSCLAEFNCGASIVISFSFKTLLISHTTLLSPSSCLSLHSVSHLPLSSAFPTLSAGEYEWSGKYGWRSVQWAEGYNWPGARSVTGWGVLGHMPRFRCRWDSSDFGS